jgi:predicted aminopeptidase
MPLKRSIFRPVATVAILVLLAGLMEGCYYLQAIRGHSDLMSRRRPVDELIEDDQSPEALRRKLQLVSDAREFASEELLLPDNDSYRTYADLERDYVVWNVFAAPEFSLQAKTWCYPVAGCVAYRGYFSEDAARKLGARLTEEGYDVAVGGVAAYSTLGRFDDPVLSTMLRWSDVDLVATIFHELAHQRLYIKDDSAFNESFATAVADIGLERWLKRSGELDRLLVYRQHQALRVDVQELVRRARADLESLYAASLDEESIRARKREILDTLSADAQALIDADGRGVRNWLSPPLNNARLVSMNLYEGQVDAFKAIYEECGRSLACFYARAEQLGELDAAQRILAMQAAASRP